MAEFQYLNGGNSEVQDKQAEAYLYASSGTTGIAATGVIEGLLVAQTPTVSGSVLISAGACLNQASLGQGADRLINPSQKTLDILTANPVGGLPRNDIIEFDSITALIIAHIGTPNATPTDPTVPATSVALARLRHAAGATDIPTAKIDPLIVATTLRGIPTTPVVVTTRYTAPTAPIAAASYIHAIAPAVTGDGAKRFRISVTAWQMTGAAGEVFDLAINDQTAGTVLALHRVPIASSTMSNGITFVATDVPAAGSHVYNCSAARVLGTGTAIIQAAATAPREITVEQIT